MKFDQMNNFQKLEAISTEAVRQLLPDSNVQFTDEFENYDAFIDKVVNGQRRIAWIETKVRNAEYDDYILEARKLKLLKQKRAAAEKELGVKINLFYLNFTPKATYIWNLDRIKVPKSTAYAGRYTAVNSAKEEKDVYYLPTKSATRVYDYVLNKEEIIKIIKDKE